MYIRLSDFLTKLEMLYEFQFGFRKKHSTHLAHLVLQDKITKSLDNGEKVIGIYLDFSKAFDTVNHDILLQKLYQYGIRGTAYEWFKGYLTDRVQYVTYNGIQSSPKQIKCGVPQGSILGPLLFFIYVNDLPNVCDNTMPFYVCWWYKLVHQWEGFSETIWSCQYRFECHSWVAKSQ